MPATVVLTDPVVRALEAKAGLPVETGGVLLASRHRADDGDVRLLARTMHWIPEAAYERRVQDEMRIASEGYTAALGLAERDCSIPLWVHTHPGGRPVRSEKDERVDVQIADLFRSRSGSDHYGTVIASPGTAGIELTGTIRSPDGRVESIARFWMVGDRWRLRQAFDRAPASAAPDNEMFDRNVRAFGEAVQRTIGMLRIGIVGCGGTGSAVAEQLVRLGAQHLLLVDADTLGPSNVTRVYGSTPRDVGRLKTDVLADHLRAIAPDLSCRTMAGRCTSQPVARALAASDLLFGCTDDNAGRLVLSRLSAYYLTPVIDMGVLLSSGAGGRLVGIDGRVTVVSPGAACLVCRGRVDSARAAAEMRTPEERRRLADEGYAPALGEVEPAVVAFTTMTAAVAVSELLERLIGYGAAPRPSEILLRMHDREISTNAAAPTPNHYCHAAAGKLGRGDTEPFLEQVWGA